MNDDDDSTAIMGKVARHAHAMLQPRDGMTYEQRAEFQRLKHADVEQGRRIAELLDEVATLRDQLRITEEMVETLGDVNVAHVERDVAREEAERLKQRVEELESENARLRRSPWEGHWS